MRKEPKKLTGAKATGSFILVEMLTEQEAMGTVLSLSGKSNYQGQQAYVLDVGPALEQDKWGIQVGDRVLLQGTFVPVPKADSTGRDLGIVSPHDIKAVLNEQTIELN